MLSTIVIFCRKACGVGADAKLLLLKLALLYRDRPFTALDAEAIKALGFSSETTGRLLLELVRAEHLTRESHHGGLRGRPVFKYWLAQDFQDQQGLMESFVPPQSWAGRNGGGHFEAVMQHLLDDGSGWAGERPMGQGNPPSREGEVRRLSASNRLLMMVLFGVADRNGVVRGWGPAELAGLAGLTPGAFKGQVEKLLGLGYLRATVPGVSGRNLFGKQPGVLFLNPAHPAFRGAVGESVLLYPIEAIGYAGGAVRDAAALYGLLSRVSNRRPVHDGLSEHSYFGGLLRRAGFADKDSIKALAAHFDGVGTSTLPAYFQVKIEEYAAGLLPYSPERCGSKEIRERLQEAIAQDFFARPYSALAGTEDRAVRLAVYLALDLARHVRRALEETPEFAGWYDEVSLGDFSYAIIPALTSSEKKHLVVSVVPVGGVMGLPRYVLAGDQVVSRVFTESEFSNEMAYKFGVLTRPLTKSNKNTRASSAKDYRYRLQAKAFSAD